MMSSIQDLFDTIRLSPEFLEKNQETTRRRLIKTYSLFHDSGVDFPSDDEMFVINRCLHLASSLVLLGSDANMVPRGIDKIRAVDAFRDRNPTTVLTIAALYYLIRRHQDSGTLEKDEALALTCIRKMFDRVNWLIGTAGMKYLGIIPADEAV